MVSELWGLALLRKWFWQKGSWTTYYQAVSEMVVTPNHSKLDNFTIDTHSCGDHTILGNVIKLKKRKGNQNQKNVYNPHIRYDSLKYCPFSIMFMQWFRIAPQWWWRLVDYRWVYHIALVIQLAANAATPMKHVDLVNSLHGTRGAES